MKCPKCGKEDGRILPGGLIKYCFDCYAAAFIKAEIEGETEMNPCNQDKGVCDYREDIKRCHRHYFNSPGPEHCTPQITRGEVAIHKRDNELSEAIKPIHHWLHMYGEEETTITITLTAVTVGTPMIKISPLT